MYVKSECKKQGFKHHEINIINGLVVSVVKLSVFSAEVWPRIQGMVTRMEEEAAASATKFQCLGAGENALPWRSEFVWRVSAPPLPHLFCVFLLIFFDFVELCGLFSFLDFAKLELPSTHFPCLKATEHTLEMVRKWFCLCVS